MLAQCFLGCLIHSYQNLPASKGVVPGLTISIQSTLAENFDVLATPNPEGNGLLESIVEVVCLPVLNIIRKLPMSAWLIPLWQNDIPSIRHRAALRCYPRS